MKKLVIEVHVGKRYGISRLNCDGAGQVKDVLIDNVRYNRISSQSKKRVWREHLEEKLDEIEHVYRTRAIKDIMMKRLAAMDTFYQENAEDMADCIVIGVLGCELKEKSKADITNQVLVFTEYDINDILTAFCEVITSPDELTAIKKETEKKSKSKNKSGNKSGNNKDYPYIQKVISAAKKRLPLRKYGVDCSLFGRMTTSDVMESVDSAVCTNHSYSFGAATMDNDYFSAIDNYLSNMKSELDSGQSGSAYLDSKDFASHVYYEYASIDVRQFYENLCKGIDMENEDNKKRVHDILIIALRCLIHDVACAAPSGGQNAFASFPDPVGVYITIRDTGTNRTADTCCMQEMHTHNSNKEDEKFIAAMHAFTDNDFSDENYIAKLYAGEHPEQIVGAEHKTMNEIMNTIEEIVNERI